MSREQSSRQLIRTGQKSDSDSEESSSEYESSGPAFEDEVLLDVDVGKLHQSPWLNWLFHNDTNPTYAQNMSLALRQAFVLTLIVLSLDMKEEENPLRGYELPAKSIIVYAITVCKTTGDTLKAARGSMCGTILSILNVYVVSAMFKGFQSMHIESMDQVVFWISLVHGMIFCAAMLLLDFHMNVRIMAIKNFVFHWMSMLAIELDGYDFHDFQKGKKELVGTLVGCVLALLTTLLPSPALAISQAGTSSITLTVALEDTWKACTEYLLSSHADAVHIGAIKRKIEKFHGTILGLKTKLDTAEWETPFMPSQHGNKRKMLRCLHGLLLEGYDRLLSVERSCEEETFGDVHAAMMNRINSEATEALSISSHLLHCCVQAALDGRINSKEAAVLEELADKTTAAAKRLSRAVLLATEQVNPSRIAPELVDERCFAFHLVGNCDMVVTFAKQLIDFQRTGEAPIADAPMSCSPFKVEKDPNHLSFVARTLPAIFLCMFIGFHGYPDIIMSSNASIACVTVICMSKFAGSTLQKTGGRLGAVIFGNLTGQFIYGFFGACDPVHYALYLFAVFLWASSTLLVYHNTGNGVGMLLAAFGCRNTARRCEDEPYKMNTKVTQDVLVALACALLVDFVMGSLPCLPQAIKMRRVSFMAASKLRESWEYITVAFKDVADPLNMETRQQKGTFLGLLSACQELGAEGAIEERGWRAAWPSDLFDHAVHVLGKVRITLSTLERAARGGGNDSARKLDIFVQATELKSVQRLCNDVSGLFAEVSGLLDIFTDAGKGACNSMGRVPTSKAELVHEENVKQIFEDFSRIAWRGGGDTLESDGVSVACVTIKCLSSIRADLLDLRTMVLSF